MVGNPKDGDVACFSEVPVPSFIVVDLAVDGYFFPSGTVETEQQLLDFLNGVLNGSIEVSFSIDSPDEVISPNKIILYPCVYFLSVREETESTSASDA